MEMIAGPPPRRVVMLRDALYLNSRQRPCHNFCRTTRAVPLLITLVCAQGRSVSAQFGQDEGELDGLSTVALFTTTPAPSGKEIDIILTL